jgi:hypothetical protein
MFHSSAWTVLWSRKARNRHPISEFFKEKVAPLHRFYMDVKTVIGS